MIQLSKELETILEASHDGIFVTDGQGVVLYVNAASARLSGRRPDELIGRSVYDLEKEAVFSPSIAVMVLRESRQVTGFEDTSIGRKVLVTGTPVFDDCGSIIRVVNNARDITELLNLREQLERAEEQASRYQSELAEMRSRHRALDRVVVESPEMQQMLWLALRVAVRDVPVMILGESGVGKNELAQVIHSASSRTDGPFIEINCGAIPETLFESELFGYESGAFTGATRGGKPGLIELAHQGTLLLNEIGEMPPVMQVKLLTVLQEGKFTRIGGTEARKADIRVIAATNRDLEQMVAERCFREDLYYRLNVVTLTIPPLRERPEDIVAQARYHLGKLNELHGTAKQFSPQAVRAMLAHRWPGNTRELRNVIERAVVVSEGDLLEPEDITLPHSRGAGQFPTMQEALEQLEAELLGRAVKRLGSSYKVAEALGMSQPTVVRRAKKYRIKLGYK